MTYQWSNGEREYMAMQGKCWTLDLSSASASQSHDNYLSGSKEFINDKNCPNGTACPWGTIYGALGMSVHASGSEVIYGAPGAYTWKGTIAARKYKTISNLKLQSTTADQTQLFQRLPLSNW